MRKRQGGVLILFSVSFCFLTSNVSEYNVHYYHRKIGFWITWWNVGEGEWGEDPNKKAGVRQKIQKLISEGYYLELVSIVNYHKPQFLYHRKFIRHNSWNTRITYSRWFSISQKINFTEFLKFAGNSFQTIIKISRKVILLNGQNQYRIHSKQFLK